MKKIIWLTVFAALFMTSACELFYPPQFYEQLVDKKTGGGGGSPVSADVYFPGYYNDGTYHAGYWKNGVFNEVTNSTVNAQVFSVVASGADVYTGGLYYDGATTLVGYWNNSGFHEMTNLANSEIYSIALNGIDVYAGGHYEDLSSQYHYGYWMNGSWVELINSSSADAEIYSIAVNGADVYAGGHYYDVISRYGYWKNGAWVELTNSSSVSSEIYSIAVSGPDIYAGGYYNDTMYRAGYWKNGSFIELTNSTYSAQVLWVSVNGTDVYAAGYYVDTGNHFNAFYSKNGVITTLPDNYSGVYFGAIATYIVIDGSDVYVGGKTGNDIATYACCWKNGVLIWVSAIDSRIGQDVIGFGPQ